jgi:predicted nucleic acid-binding Zn finger protein
MIVGVNTITPNNVTFHSPHLASVKSYSTNERYEVNLSKGTCSCPDFLFRGFKIAGYRCKHLKEALEEAEDLFHES